MSDSQHMFILFVYLFYIPLIFTDVELVIHIVSIVDKEVYIVVPYCNMTVSKVKSHIWKILIKSYFRQGKSNVLL
jgi:hypothetical protein